MKTLHSIIREAIASFDADPPDSDHQRGYLAALRELARYEHDKLPNDAAIYIAEEAFTAGVDYAIDRVTKCCPDDFPGLAWEGWCKFEPSQLAKDLTT